MRGKITKRSVDALSVPEAEAEATLWDTELAGFGIRCRATAKTYILQYRVGGGRKAALRKMTIGKHGSPWTPETARVEAKRLLGLVAAGDDPAEKRAADRAVLTLAELCDLYLAEGTCHKKPGTIKVDRARLANHIKPLLGRKRIDAITRADIERMRDAVKNGATAAKRPDRDQEDGWRGRVATGGAGVAAQCVILMGVLLGFAKERGLRTGDNPAHGVTKHKVRKMERFLSEEEISALTAALDAEEARSGSPYAVAALKLLMLTGARRGEILTLRWEHVNFEFNCLLLPDSKTGKKSIYLSAPAVDLLRSIPRLKDNPFVIPGVINGAHLTGLDGIWYRVRAAARLPGVRVHDLRHTFVSVAAARGVSLPVIGALVGHRNASTTERYAHLSADPVRAANEAVGARIAAAMQRPTAAPDTDGGGNVISLVSRRRGPGAGGKK